LSPRKSIRGLKNGVTKKQVFMTLEIGPTHMGLKKAMATLTKEDLLSFIF